MATDLDQLYLSAADAGFDGEPNELLWAAILATARRSLRDEDAVSDACTVILAKLSAFTPRSYDSFSHWVRSILRRFRMKSNHRDHVMRKRDAEFDESLIVTDEDRDFIDWIAMTAFQRRYAELVLFGHSATEIAPMLGLGYGAMQQHLYRDRVKYCAAHRINE